MTEYLLVPMQPTPNGRMHIGHGGGTYLRADVLARYLTSRGHKVTIITGSDAYENWVLAESLRLGMDPVAVCERYHAEIHKDLTALNISLDEWIDPLSDVHRDKYIAVHERALSALQGTGAARLEEERVPISPTTGETMVGTWIAGECPTCGASAGGSSCVKCGDHFQPEELKNPHSRLDDSALEWKTISSWFAHPRDLDELSGQIIARDLRPAIAEPALRYLQTKSGRVRLSGGGSWGIKSSLVGDESVLMNSYYLYSVYCGEVYKRHHGSSRNPFEPRSGVSTVGFFGTDNTTPGVIVPAVIAQGSGGTLRPFDHVVLNGMLNFEGEKCSTSKRHGIWVSEVLASNYLNSDELRFALAQAQLDHGADDITLEQLVDRINYVRLRVLPAIAVALDQLHQDPVFRASSKLRDALFDQDQAMTPGQMDTAKAVRLVRDWTDTQSHISAPEWLVGFVLLAAPIMPRLSEEVWRAIGRTDQINSAFIEDVVKLDGSREFAGANQVRLSESDLRPFIRIGAQ